MKWEQGPDLQGKLFREVEGVAAGTEVALRLAFGAGRLPLPGENA